MGGHPFADIPCKLCSKPVDLSADLSADENGKAVLGEISRLHSFALLHSGGARLPFPARHRTAHLHSVLLNETVEIGTPIKNPASDSHVSERIALLAAPDGKRRRSHVEHRRCFTRVEQV